jgi:hypothetical protein
MTDYRKEIAETILAQMGGGHALRLMLGVGRFGFGENEKEEVFLSFQFKGCEKANYCTVYLTPLDVYRVEFCQNTEEVETFTDVYADQLVTIFRGFTGLEPRVPAFISYTGKAV